MINALNKLADKWLLLTVFLITTAIVVARPDVDVFAHAWTLVLGGLLATFKITIEKQATVHVSDPKAAAEFVAAQETDE